MTGAAVVRGPGSQAACCAEWRETLSARGPGGSGAVVRKCTDSGVEMRLGWVLSRSDGLLLSSREQLESFYVRRAHHGEVAAVEGGNGRDVEPFRNSDDRGVGSA